MMVCTEPLPNERVPTRVARLWSCSAPATISDADAEPPLIRTITGLPLVRSPGCAARRWVSSALRPRVETISARSKKVAGNGHRLFQQAAGVIAQVDDVAFQLVTDLVLHVADFPLQAFSGLLVEGGDADIADIVAFDMRAHRADADVVAHQRDVDRVV